MTDRRTGRTGRKRSASDGSPARKGVAPLEAILEKLAREWRGTFDAIESPILMLDLEGRIVRLNRAAQKLSGREFGEILGRPVEEVARGEPWEDMKALSVAVAASRAGTSRQVRAADGRHWDLSASFLGGELAEGARVILMARDVTRVVELEASLRRAEAMSAMGALVAGVAHEVRNPLFAMSGTLDALEARLGGEEQYAPYTAVLREELERVARVMRELLEYGKPWRPEISEVDVGELARQAALDCDPLARERMAEIVLRHPPGLPLLRVDRARIGQVLRNLVENALQHAPPASAVSVEARRMEIDGRAWLEVAVADRGAGFGTQDLKRVFEPFFSRRRGGTGLGLSIVHRNVEAHGGSVTAANRPGGGAIVTFSVPWENPLARGSDPSAPSRR